MWLQVRCLVPFRFLYSASTIWKSTKTCFLNSFLETSFVEIFWKHPSLQIRQKDVFIVLKLFSQKTKNGQTYHCFCLQGHRKAQKEKQEQFQGTRNSKPGLSTWIEGLEVNRREIPRPSNASLQRPSVRVSQSPFDFPKALVCIFEDAVSRGYTIIVWCIVS